MNIDSVLKYTYMVMSVLSLGGAIYYVYIGDWVQGPILCVLNIASTARYRSTELSDNLNHRIDMLDKKIEENEHV